MPARCRCLLSMQRYMINAPRHPFHLRGASRRKQRQQPCAKTSGLLWDSSRRSHLRGKRDISSSRNISCSKAKYTVFVKFFVIRTTARPSLLYRQHQRRLAQNRDGPGLARNGPIHGLLQCFICSDARRICYVDRMRRISNYRNFRLFPDPRRYEGRRRGY